MLVSAFAPFVFLCCGGRASAVHAATTDAVHHVVMDRTPLVRHTAPTAKRGRPSLPDSRLTANDLAAESAKSKTSYMTLQEEQDLEKARSEEAAAKVARAKAIEKIMAVPIIAPHWPPTTPLPPCADESTAIIEPEPLPDRVLQAFEHHRQLQVQVQQQRAAPAPTPVARQPDLRSLEYVSTQRARLNAKFRVERERFVVSLEEAITRVDLWGLASTAAKIHPSVSVGAMQSGALGHTHHRHTFMVGDAL